MKLFQKDYMKSTLILMVCIIFVQIIVMYVVMQKQYEDYKNGINTKLTQIIEEVIEIYPEAEVPMIQILLKEEKRPLEQKLEKYGIDTKEVIAVKEIEQRYQLNVGINIGIIAFMGILCMGIIIRYFIRRDKKIEKITQYIQKVRNRNYSLELEDYTQGDLSKLKSELYKITVLLREQNETLQQEKVSLSNFLSDISHQIKTPLTSMSIMIDALQENKKMPESKKEEFIKELSREIDWMNWLVLTLLKLSKLDAGTIEFYKQEVKVEEVFNSVKENLAIPIEIKQICIQVQGDCNISFQVDKNWIVEAFTNIVKNAIEHSKEEGRIWIQYEQNNLFTKIKIKDEGNGIEKEDLPHIFERFYKGKDSNSNSIGIGLALAKAIIQRHGGEIQVKSEKEHSLKSYFILNRILK